MSRTIGFHYDYSIIYRWNLSFYLHGSLLWSHYTLHAKWVTMTKYTSGPKIFHLTLVPPPQVTVHRLKSDHGSHRPSVALHFLLSKSSPMQPLCPLTPSWQYRLFDCVPTSHVTEHTLHAVHPDQYGQRPILQSCVVLESHREDDFGNWTWKRHLHQVQLVDPTRMNVSANVFSTHLRMLRHKSSTWTSRCNLLYRYCKLRLESEAPSHKYASLTILNKRTLVKSRHNVGFKHGQESYLWEEKLRR